MFAGRVFETPGLPHPVTSVESHAYLSLKDNIRVTMNPYLSNKPLQSHVFKKVNK
jgi:hypothetical protein